MFVRMCTFCFVLFCFFLLAHYVVLHKSRAVTVGTFTLFGFLPVRMFFDSRESRSPTRVFERTAFIFSSRNVLATDETHGCTQQTPTDGIRGDVYANTTCIRNTYYTVSPGSGFIRLLLCVTHGLNTTVRRLHGNKLFQLLFESQMFFFSFG